MNNCMEFPDTVEEFMEEYKIVDTEHIYSNGTEYVPIFRMKQWFEHLPSAEKTGRWIKKKNIMLGDYIECSLCKNAESRIAPGWWNAKRYCPNCGARMEDE